MFKKVLTGVIVLLLGCVAVWLWATIALWRRAESDREFQSQHEQAWANRAKGPSGQRNHATEPVDRARIEAFLLHAQEDRAWTEEALERMRRRGRLRDLQGMAMISGMGIMLVWILGAGLYGVVQNRRWESPNRKVLAGAGIAVRELLENAGRLEARESDMGQQRVEIDAGAARITFHHFSFITSFWRNPAQERVELDFNELLIVTLHVHKGTRSLRLRTTRGAVVVYDKVEPFEPLARLLFDIAELNRSSPGQFQAMLQREAKVKTPWYGWLILAGAVAAVAAFGYWVWNLGA